MMQKSGKRLNRSFGGDLGIFVFIALTGIFMALPVVYAISNAFKPFNELWLFPPRFFVRRPTLKNFRDIFIIMSNSWVPFSRYIFNTFFISIAGTAGHVILSSMCAYALAKHKFYGARLIFNIIVLSLMFNATVTAIPNYLIIANLGWIDKFWSLIVPAFAAPLGLYLMKQFMEQMLPDAMLQSARIDGASEWKMFWIIVMPIVKPAWLTLIIFSFQGLWNIGNTVYIYREEMKTLNYALGQIIAGGIARAGVGSAIGVLMMVVPVLIFLLTQSNIITTMSTSGMKE